MKWILSSLAVVAVGCSTAQTCLDLIGTCQAPNVIKVRHGRCVCEPPPAPPVTPIPTPIPTVTPIPTPEPTSVPTPTPPPTPEPLCNALRDCGRDAPQHEGTQNGCCLTNTTGDKGAFYEVLLDAQARVQAKHPDWYTWDGRLWRVPDEAAYTAAVVEEVRGMGLCAVVGGPSDEVGIKTTDEWSDQYDVLTWRLQVITDFKCKCTPARF